MVGPLPAVAAEAGGSFCSPQTYLQQPLLRSGQAGVPQRPELTANSGQPLLQAETLLLPLQAGQLAAEVVAEVLLVTAPLRPPQTVVLDHTDSAAGAGAEMVPGLMGQAVMAGVVAAGLIMLV